MSTVRRFDSVVAAAIVAAVGGAGCVKSVTLRSMHRFTAGYSARPPRSTLLSDTARANEAKPGTLLFSVRPRRVELRTLTERTGADHDVAEWRELSEADLAGPPRMELSRTSGAAAPAVGPDAGPWDQAYSAVLRAYADPAHPLEMVEPDFEEESAAGTSGPPPAAASTAARVVAASAAPGTSATSGVANAPLWPAGGDIGWSRGPNYSQLQSAIEYFDGKPDLLATPIQIAHLDTGYAAQDPLFPPTVAKSLSISFFDGGVPEDGVGHGNSTLSALAGGHVVVRGEGGAVVYDGVLGANPFATVREYQISSSKPTFSDGFSWGPVHLVPKRMAAAITAAVDNDVDVISLSAGGMPSLVQMKAVNHAYESGTAIFAATGDFITLPIIPYGTPKEVVYPANYGRVMGVAGVTSEGRSYGKAPCYLCVIKFWDWGSWMFRGSYGPEASMRGHVISSYAPNVSHSGGAGTVDRDGGGTSHATPQVAGAAALWLAAHQKEIPAGDWRSWKKTEAVYQALIQTADQSLPEYEVETMGVGVMRARKLLEQTIDLSTLAERPQSTIDPFWLVKELLSMGLLTPPGVMLRQGLIDMIETEIHQIAYRSNAVRWLLAKLNLQHPADQRKLAKAILDSGEASAHLADWLRAFLK